MYFYLSKILSPFLDVVNFIIFGVFIFLFLYLVFKKKYFKLILIFFVSIFFIFSFFPFGNLGLKYLEEGFLDKKSNLTYNNIIVLAGSESIFHTKLSKILNLNAASERLISSVDLALKNPKSKIIFVGGSGYLSASDDDYNEIDVAKLFYNNVGFDLERVIFVGSTRNTIENIKKIKKLNLINKNDILITSAFHMKRSMLISEKFDIKLIPYAVDFRQTVNEGKFLNFYQNFRVIDNLRKLNLFFREILGIFAVKLIL